MKLLVGTLYSGENEFEDCCESIRRQSYEDFEHLILKNLGKAEAHDRLYTTFMERGKEFDLLIKIDADMVIQDSLFFGEIVEEFNKTVDLDWLSIPCFDFLVGRNLGEVNVYRNVVKWGRNEDNLFTDRTHERATIRRRKKWEVSEMEPMIVHCGNPSPFQAFHFGFHRTAKAIGKGYVRARYQARNWATIRDVLARYGKLKDRRLAYVIAGADCALSTDKGEAEISYTNSALETEFDRYRKAVDAAGEDILSRLKSVRRLIHLPFPWDYRIAFFYFRLKAVVSVRNRNEKANQSERKTGEH